MTKRSAILVVDDDPRLCRSLRSHLHGEGYSVEIARSAVAMRAVLAEKTFDLVILDMQLPGEDGMSLVRWMRDRLDAGLILLTGRNEPIDRVAGLDLGADDCLAKPFETRELLARIRSVLRRAGRSAGRPEGPRGPVRFAGWHLDLPGRALTAPDGRAVPLTTCEFRLLAALVSHPNRVLSRDEILDAVADRGWTPLDRSADVLVGKIRRKLNDDPREPRLIKTVRGAGYLFVGPVEPG